MELDFLTGFEHGVISSSGSGLFTGMGVNGFESAPASGFGWGTYELRINQTPVAGGGWVSRNTSGSPTIVTERFYFRFPSLPVNAVILSMFVPAAGLEGYFGYAGSSGTGLAGVIWQGGAFLTGEGVAISAGVVYRADVKVNFGVNPRTITCEISEVHGDSLGGNSKNSAEATSTCAAVALGNNHNNETYDCRFKDWVFKQSDVFPIGPGQVVALKPTADGTHSPASPDCVENGAGTLISGGNAAYQYLDDQPLATSTTTDRLSIRTAHASDYVEWVHGDLDADETNINGVRALAVVKNPTADPATCAVVLLDNDGQETGVVGTSSAPATLTNSTLEYRGAKVALPSGGWTRTQVNALKGRFGYSTDVSPKPGLYSFMLEVDVAPLDLTIQDATHGHTADNVTLTQGHILTVEDATHAHAGDSPNLGQVHQLAISDASHAHAADNLVLTQASSLVIQDALHAHTAEELFLADLEQIAFHSRSYKKAGARRVAEVYGWDDTFAMNMVLLAAEAGFDVGRPQEKR